MSGVTRDYFVVSLVRAPDGHLDRVPHVIRAKSAASAVAQVAVWIQRDTMGREQPDVVAISAQRKVVEKTEEES